MASSIFPSEATAQVEWFADSANYDFSNLKSKPRKEIVLQFQELIVAVTGMNNVEALENLCQEFLYKTSVWKYQSGYTTLSQRVSLKNAILNAIDQRYNHPRVEGYSTWINKAMASLVQIEITTAKGRDREAQERQRRKDLASPPVGLSNLEMRTTGVACFHLKEETDISLSHRSISNNQTTHIELQDVIQRLTQQHEKDRTEFMGALTRQNQQIQRLRRNLEGKDRKTPQYEVHHSKPLCSPRDTPSSTECSLSNCSQINGTSTKFLGGQTCQGYQPVQPPYEMMQMPSFITNLKSMRISSGNRNADFTFDFLSGILGGIATSNGRYYIPPVSRRCSFSRELRCYRLLSSDYEPLLPHNPGQHGAQISFVIPDHIEDTTSFPLFIRQAEGNFRYFGHYREPRAPDKLSGIEILQVPFSLKKHWAKHLSSPAVIEKLRAISLSISATKSTIAITEDCSHHQFECDSDSGNFQNSEVNIIWMRNILDAFERSDFASKPSLRLFYEYLEFLYYDDQFYQELFSMKHRMHIEI